MRYWIPLSPSLPLSHPNLANKSIRAPIIECQMETNSPSYKYAEDAEDVLYVWGGAKLGPPSVDTSQDSIHINERWVLRGGAGGQEKQPDRGGRS